MRRFRILCIPPYEGMRDLVENIAARRSDVEIIVNKGNLEEGLQIIRSAEGSNVDAIISRGCTTEMIRENINVLTCDIAPSVYDILRIIRTANQTGYKFAVVGYHSITQAAKMLRNIIEYDFRVCTIHSREECLENLNVLKNEGFQLIVGDMMAVDYAREMDMHSLLVTSGIESIEAAIEATVDILRNYDDKNQKIDLFTELISSSDHITVIYDSNEDLYYTSSQELPEDIFEAMKQNSSVVIARGKLSMIRNRKRSVYTIHGQRISTKGMDFCAYHVMADKKTDLYDKYSLREVSAEEGMPDIHPIEYYLGNDDISTSLLETANRYSNMNQPVMILGDRGTGKERFAYYIYSNSRLKQSSMIITDAGLMDEKGWRYLLENDYSPLNTSGITLYFKRMELIPPAWQQKLMIYFKESNIFKTNRLMFSYTMIDGAEPNDDLYLYLCENANCLTIRLPSLSERRMEIPSLVGLYINVCNIEHGTQVVGLTAEAMLVIQSYHWTRNVYQLYQTIQELVLNSEAAYISAESVRKVLARLAPKRTQNALPGINLDRTLDEIERDIVKMVYESENMNQSQTAKHLGISRSTVWRLLK
ncbi:MAG: PrpR N-terminal domain-containing protein [Clostridiales bacterium]|nr:PrpR N-terminal domain-containing protein [Clostridiales bacterium]